MRISVLTRKELYYTPDDCEAMKKRAIFITSEDWKKQRISMAKNCQLQQCKQLIGAFDSMFIAIDQALQKIPAP